MRRDYCAWWVRKCKEVRGLNAILKNWETRHEAMERKKEYWERQAMLWKDRAREEYAKNLDIAAQNRRKAEKARVTNKIGLTKACDTV